MSCKIDFKKKPIKWNIKLQNDNVLNSLYKKNEYAGRLQFELKKNEMVSSLINFKEGNSSSVETIPGLVNFHTHPFSCYNGEKCIFGSPSGEDMRELIRFGLQGNLCHLVVALEGTYVIQVNPCYLKIIKNKKFKINDKIKGDTARGVVAYLIEMYFRSTHGHRSIEYNNTLKENNIEICQPKDWVNFANKFKFSNYFSKQNKCSKNLPCNGIPEHNSFGSSTICPIDYINTYGTDGQYKLDIKGDAYYFNKYKDIASELLNNDFDKLVNIFKEGCNKGSSIVWNSEQWFYVKFFPNKFKIDNTFVTYNSLIKKQKDPTKIFKYWKKCQQCKNNIKLGNPYIKFHPLVNHKCKIKLGSEMKKWIEGTGNVKLKDLKK